MAEVLILNCKGVVKYNILSQLSKVARIVTF
jgi:hypothetical protein